MIEPAGAHTVREHNRALLLQAIAEAGGRSRAQLATATGLARATVSTQVDELLASSLITEATPERPARGRPASPLALNPAGPAALGIEINIGYLSIGVVDLTGELRAERILPADHRTASMAVTVNRVATLARELLAATGLTAAAVSLALPALVNQAGTVVRAPNLPTWVGTSITETLSTALALPVVTVGNEANLAALAEHRFTGSPESFVMISGEIGIGGGLVLDGDVFTGVHGFAGELGHISVDHAGPECGCGGRGCVEQFAGLSALLRSGGVGGLDELIAAARATDRAAVAALRRAGLALGIALSGVINAVDLPAVVIGGSLAPLVPWLSPALEAELAARVVSGFPVAVTASELGRSAAMLGAAATVRDAILTGTLPA